MLKILRTFIFAFALCVSFNAVAELTELTSPTESLFYHIRLKAPKHKNLKFNVYWNCSENDSTLISLEIEPPTHDDFYPSVCRYCIRNNDSIIAQGKEEFAYKGKGEPGFSVLINVDRTGAELSLGTNTASRAFNIDFDRHSPGSIGYKSFVTTEELANVLITRSTEPRRKSSFASVDSLKAHIAASEDIYEGIWEYLDRDVDRSKADLGAFYTLATVANGNGGYDIVYLGGENNYSYPWQPLEIKGELQRTPFIDNFDLIWTSADGRTLRRDTNATFEAGHAALRLNFPLLNSSVRFRRSLNR